MSYSTPYVAFFALFRILISLYNTIPVTGLYHLAQFRLPNASVIAATYKIFVPPDRQATILEALLSFVGPTEVKPGCLSCRVTQDVSDPEVIIYTEEWQSQDALESHIRSQRYHFLLTIIDLSRREPEVRFTTTAQEWGMEFIEAVRIR